MAEVPDAFSEAVCVRGHGNVHYVAEAGAVVLAWPRRALKRAASRRALAAIVDALDGQGSVEEARLAFIRAAMDAGVLRSRTAPKQSSY